LERNDTDLSEESNVEDAGSVASAVVFVAEDATDVNTEDEDVLSDVSTVVDDVSSVVVTAKTAV